MFCLSLNSIWRFWARFPKIFSRQKFLPKTYAFRFFNFFLDRLICKVRVSQYFFATCFGIIIKAAWMKWQKKRGGTTVQWSSANCSIICEFRFFSQWSFLREIHWLQHRNKVCLNAVLTLTPDASVRWFLWCLDRLRA